MKFAVRFRSRRFHFEWLMLLVGLLLVAGLLAISLDEEYHQIEDREQTHLQAVARLAALAVGQRLKKTDSQIADEQPQTTGEPAALTALLDALRDTTGTALSLSHDDQAPFLSAPTTIVTSASDQHFTARQQIAPADMTTGKPLLLTVSRDRQAVFADWRRAAIAKAVFVSLLGLLLGGVLYFYQRRQRHDDFLAATQAAERRRAEEQLRTLSRALDQSAAAVLITDAQGSIEYVNPACCTMYGYSAAELIGNNPSCLRSDLTTPGVYAAMWATILAGEVWRGELTNCRRDGGLLEVALSIAPVRNDAGHIRHFVATADDIAQRRENERQQRQLDVRMAKLERMDVLSVLAGGIAHDFNNILVGILGYSSIGQTVLRNSDGSARVIGYFGEIEAAGERAKLLVQQLASFGSSGRMAVEAVRLADIIGETIRRVGLTFPAEAILSAEIADDLPPLTIDPAHLRQILLNLCCNARDAISGQGRVVVAAELVTLTAPQICASCHREFAGEFFRITVSDNGHGIAEAIRERVFEPFFTTRDVGSGNGMGLAVVHGMTHSYKGHLSLDSAEGKGCSLSIYLPRVARIFDEPTEGQ